MGTHGDLGTAFKWEAPFPDMKPTFKKYTKKAVNEAVSLVNGRKWILLLFICSLIWTWIWI
jgi:hypothetical protein